MLTGAAASSTSFLGQEDATHPCMPTENQPESFQQDDDEVANDEGEWTVVKRKKPRDTGRVSKTLLKLRAPHHVWENMSSSESFIWNFCFGG